jgi:hypothetical protein
LRLYLGDVDVEEADRVAIELALSGLVAPDLGQAGSAVTLQAPIQRGTGQVRDRRLERVKTVVQRQQRVLAEDDDDRFFLG